MTYQYHGHPVAGGTFPALIWKAFMQKAIPYLKLQPRVVLAARRRCTRRRSPS